MMTMLCCRDRLAQGKVFLLCSSVQCVRGVEFTLIGRPTTVSARQELSSVFPFS